MANTKSAKKRIRTSLRKQIRNKAVRTRTRNAVKAARVAIETGSAEEGVEAVRVAYSELDRAAIKGVIHKRNSSRRKSRLMKQLAKKNPQS